VRVLVLHPTSNYNIGDLLTYRGTQEILRTVDPDVEFLMFDALRAEKELDTYMSQFYWGDVDILVLAGSPWLWFGLEHSLKAQVLLKAILRFPQAKKIALGVGSCFPLYAVDSSRLVKFDSFDQVYSELVLFPQTINYISTLFGGFDLVVTRDAMAQAVFSKLGIQSYLSKDTSRWALQTLRRRGFISSPLCIFQDPRYSLSKNSLPEGYLNEFLRIQVEYAKTKGADVYSVSAEDTYSAVTLGLENARYVSDLDWMALHMFGRPEVLSGRLHMGLLAGMMDAVSVRILPLDSRILTVIPDKNFWPSNSRITVQFPLGYSYEVPVVPSSQRLNMTQLIEKVVEVLH